MPEFVTEAKKQRLFWNAEGDIACDRHAPSTLSDMWRREDWQLVRAREVGILRSRATGMGVPVTASLCPSCRAWRS